VVLDLFMVFLVGELCVGGVTLMGGSSLLDINQGWMEVEV
jgi:hypothetical protein